MSHPLPTTRPATIARVAAAARVAAVGRVAGGRAVAAALATAVLATPAAAAAAVAAPGAPAGGRSAFALTSAAFAEGGTIPAVHECTSAGPDPRRRNESPPLAWSGAPAGAAAYAVVMRDLDNRDLLHWVLYDIPADAAALPQNVEHAYEPAVPRGARQAYYRGSATLFGYQGPCSPNAVNTYEFVVHAVDRAALPGLSRDSSIRDVAAAVTRASLGTARLTGES
ncbi:hypothetical protein GCM10010123_36970 [Pilimelia anulata]|uniref:YbhB/YbcL family Raf kinase inhibitor-like protein n=1 Tax=Pilimelia anulata TaxID=53371 RepID=A0A8J3FDB4_9ACTN|nr:YbhB/YbcL family Raf kinase inhibitor-like protein [Pilimelia anulata]GGK03641.1 hypothetical protein GCM10010123_36970 [Pilimelia anulata]